MRLLVLTGVLLVSACTFQQGDSALEAKTNNAIRYLTVLHTNDNHGRFWQNDKGEYGMAARKTLVDRLRAEANAKGHAVLLLSGGDINTGIPESDLQYAEPDFKGMALLGYDAMAIGNHEFDNPLPVLEKQQSWVNFPFLSANIIDPTNGAPVFKPYTLIDKGGLSIAVIGLTTTDTAKIGNPEYIGHLRFADPVEVTKALSQEIEQKYRPDVTIAVTHMGHYVDANFGINAPGDVTLARELPAGTLDMIVGGHSQEPVCMEGPNKADLSFKPGAACRPDRQNGTWIMQAHEWGKYVGKAEFRIEGEKVELESYQLIPVNLLAEGASKEHPAYAGEYIRQDPQMLAFLTPFQEKGQAKLGGKLGFVNGKLNGDRNQVRFKQTNLGRLIAKAQSEHMGADFGIISGGGIRDSIESGDISYKDIMRVHPFKNRINYIDMSGQEITDYLSTIARFPPDSGAYTQFYNVSFELCNGALSQLKIAGKAVVPTQTYRMSVNSYNAAGGDGFPRLTEHPGFVARSDTDAQILEAYVRAHSPLDAAALEPAGEVSVTCR